MSSGSSLFSDAGHELAPLEWVVRGPRRRTRPSGLPNFGRGFNVTDAEIDNRLLRYYRIGRLCQPRRGHCEFHAATRALRVVPLDERGNEVGPEEIIICCSLHTSNWTKFSRVRVLEIIPLPPQRLDPTRRLGPLKSVIEGRYHCTPETNEFCPDRPTRHLVLVEFNIETGRPRLGAQEFYATCCIRDEQTWDDSDRVMVIERGDLVDEDIAA